jgi:hypothetical protein
MEYESEIISLLSALRPSLVDTVPQEIEVKKLSTYIFKGIQKISKFKRFSSSKFGSNSKELC